MRWLRRALICIAVLYAALVAFAYFAQERVIFAPQPELAVPPEGLGISDERIETADGETLVGWYTEAQPNCPTVIMFHGNAEHLSYQESEIRALKEIGAGALAIGFRGYSGSTGKPSEDGLYEDARSAYAFTRSKNITAEDIVIFGFSIGAAPAVKLATEETAGAVALGAPFYSAVQLGIDNVPFLPVSLLIKHPFRTDTRIATVEEPILIVHGTADKIVPARHSARLKDLAPDNITRVEVAGASHNNLTATPQFKSALTDFLFLHYPNCSQPLPNGDTQ